MKLNPLTTCLRRCMLRSKVSFTSIFIISMRRASDVLRKLSIVQRKCLFNDESIQQLPVYSYNACILVCRAQAAIRLCGCRPYYYPFMNGTSCPPAGLLCLALNKWPQSAGACLCAKTCIEIVYTQNSLKKINW